MEHKPLALRMSSSGFVISQVSKPSAVVRPTTLQGEDDSIHKVSILYLGDVSGGDILRRGQLQRINHVGNKQELQWK